MPIGKGLKARLDAQKRRSLRPPPVPSPAPLPRTSYFFENDNDNQYGDDCENDSANDYSTVDSDAYSLEKLTSTAMSSRLSRIADTTTNTYAAAPSTASKIHSLNHNVAKYRASANAHAHESAELRAKMEGLSHVRRTNEKQQETIENQNRKISELGSRLKESEYNALMINKRLEKEKKVSELWSA